MCGIVGVAGKIDTKLMLAFRDMLTVNQVRGTDATGVVRVNSAGGYKWKKSLGTPNFLMETRFYDKEIETFGAKAFIGHCRAKTIGENIVANAHPFEFSDTIGVHNGTLRSHYTMERARDFDVDSEWLYWHINEYGLKDTISQLDNEGAWALVYWDNKAKTLNFLRNERRPLWFAYTKDQTAMLWASEPWFFSAATRRGIELHVDSEGKKFYELPIETHLSFTIDASKTKPSEIFSVKVTNDVKGEVRKYSGNWQQKSNLGNGGNNGGSVPSPFLKNDLLDDPLPQKLQSLLPPITQTPAESTPIVSTVDKPASLSQPNTALSTDLNDGKNGQRPKLSLVSKTSNDSPPVNNVNTAKKCSEITESYEKPKVSFRTLANIPFITDNKTGLELAEARFDQLTGGCCTFCKKPIGDVTDVNEIFVHSDDRPFKPDQITFICNTCIEPNPMLVASGYN